MQILNCLVKATSIASDEEGFFFFWKELFRVLELKELEEFWEGFCEEFRQGDIEEDFKKLFKDLLLVVVQKLEQIQTQKHEKEGADDEEDEEEENQ